MLPILLLALLPAPTAHAEDADRAGVLAWVNSLRTQRGLPQLGVDPLLEEAAAAYAADLGRRGVLSHVDERGRRALERVHAAGGTTVLVGEILGSGAALRSVTAAWEASTDHREIVLNPLWTHCGPAALRYGTTAVWVVLFTSHRIWPLEILHCAGGYLIRGRLAAEGAEEPVLLSGIEPVDPLHWDPSSGQFSFFVPTDRERIYHRLGYRSPEGGVIVTNTFYPIAALTYSSPESDALTSDREEGCR